VSFEQVTFALAITAIILALLTIVLTVWFFIIQTNDIKQAAKDRSKFSEQMHYLLGEIRGKVYATQEQLNQQFEKVLDPVIELARQKISQKTTPLIEDVQRLVDEAIDKEPQTEQVKAQELKEIKRRLVDLTASIGMIAQSSFAQSSAEIKRQAQSVPCWFHGTVRVNGATVPDGTVVKAIVEGYVHTTTTTTPAYGASHYFILIPNPLGVVFEGKTVTFMIGNLTATETGSWAEGRNILLNLNATSKP